MLSLYLSLLCYAENDGIAIGYGLGQDIIFEDNDQILGLALYIEVLFIDGASRSNDLDGLRLHYANLNTHQLSLTFIRKIQIMPASRIQTVLNLGLGPCSYLKKRTVFYAHLCAKN